MSLLRKFRNRKSFRFFTKSVSPEPEKLSMECATVNSEANDEQPVTAAEFEESAYVDEKPTSPVKSPSCAVTSTEFLEITELSESSTPEDGHSQDEFEKTYKQSSTRTSESRGSIKWAQLWSCFIKCFAQTSFK